MRPPDFTIGSEDRPYLRRWWVIPRNRFFNIYLHQILRSDDDRAFHDHPWWNASFILKGGYWEAMPYDYQPDGRPYGNRIKWRGRFAIVFRRATAAHRLVLADGRRRTKAGESGFELLPCWSLFFTGPTVRRWGFWCPKGWRFWKDFVSITSGGNDIGKGCED